MQSFDDSPRQELPRRSSRSDHEIHSMVSRMNSRYESKQSPRERERDRDRERERESSREERKERKERDSQKERDSPRESRHQDRKKSSSQEKDSKKKEPEVIDLSQDMDVETNDSEEKETKKEEPHRHFSFEINNLPPDIKNHLTSSDYLESVQKESKAKITVQGKSIRNPKRGEIGLHLSITGSQSSVDKAKRKLSSTLKDWGFEMYYRVQ
jgi:hypothetical protein